MTRSAWPLRTVAAERLAQEAIFARCVALGWPVEWQPLPVHASLLRYRQHGPHGEVTSLVQPADWAEQQCPSLPGLAWEALDAASAQGLFGAPAAGPVAADWLNDGQTQWQGMVPAPEAAAPLPCVRTAAGPVWIEALTVDTAWMPALALPEQVPLSVQYRLARLRLPLAQLQRLGIGDTVIVPQMEPVALVSGRPLFSFGFSEGHMIITDFDASLPLGELPVPTEAADPTAPALKLAAVPVTVEVVLCHMALTVGELAQLQPGSTMPLAEDVHRQIELRVNGHLLARGELVQVGEQLGVQIQGHASTS